MFLSSKCIRLSLRNSTDTRKYLVNQAVKFGGVERLFQVPAGSQSQATDRVFFLSLGTYDDDRDFLGNTQGRGFFQKLEAIHDRHVDVEENKLDIILTRQ